MKPKNSNCDKTQTLTSKQIKWLQNSKTLNITKRKHPNCENTEEFFNTNSDNTPIVDREKLNNLNYDKIQKLKLQQNLTTQIVIKLKKSNCDKTQKLTL